MKSLRLSTILILLGVILLAVGAAYPMVTLVVDTTPPQITETVPADGQTYQQVTTLKARVIDSESGVGSLYLYFEIYNPDGTLFTKGYIPRVSGNDYDSVYSYNLSALSPPTPVTASGQNYKVYFKITNHAGLVGEVTNYFTIYTQLQGKWYIADQEITSTSQTIYVATTTVAFKFVKTAGVEDSKITCEVWEGTTKLLTLTNTAASTWEGSYTLTSGTHNIALKASDGTTTITYSVVGLTIPGAAIIVLTNQQMLMLAGIISIIAGVIARRKKA